MYKYIMIDFDGTLVDTNEIVVEGLKQATRKFLNRELPDEEIKPMLGYYVEEQMKIISQDRYPEMFSYYKEFYEDNKDNLVKEFPGIRAMLTDLKKLGCKIAIVSAKSREGIQHGLDLFDYNEFIDVIISAHDIKNNKPDPEPAEKALQALGATKEEALLVGDSRFDVLCGKNAGVKTVFVDWSIVPKDEIIKLNPDFHIKSANELVEIVSKG